MHFKGSFFSRFGFVPRQIERLQNVHLRRAYEAQKKHMCHKNKQRVEAGEKLLYHGTTQDNCDSIGKTGFNRSFSGQNGKESLQRQRRLCFSGVIRSDAYFWDKLLLFDHRSQTLLTRRVILGAIF